jgi:major membrane immunogen (membrane-anchored lipoprotein)
MKRILFYAIVAVSILTACKKSDDIKPTPTIVGFWKGKESSSSSNGLNTINIALVLKDDGKVKYYYNFSTDTAASMFKANGTYEFRDNLFKALIYNSDGTIGYSYVATVNSEVTKTSNGTWGKKTSFTDGGTFYLDKQ